MIPRECKRLIEVDFPFAKVSYYAAREKFIRHGHPSTLHLWWARRPLASCRAVLLGLLLPDPEDPLCPPEFITRAMELLGEVPGPAKDFNEGLRKALLNFIGEFANWNLSGDSLWLDTARGLVKAAHPEETPLVVDPFAGGGSIPLEALRLGCEAFASDLNPVACLILKVLLEDIPRHGAKLAKELRKVGERIKVEAEKELAQFYPLDPPDPKTGVRAQPIAYIWARTVRCEAPHCGAEIPLVRGFWLCKKAGKKIALRPVVKRLEGRPPQVEFEIFAPARDSEVSGTVSRAKAKCLACTSGVLAPERVRAQLIAQQGGADVIFDREGNRIGGAQLLAVVTLKPNQRGRFYRLPTSKDYKAVFQAQQALLEKTTHPLTNGLTAIPNEPVDEHHHDVNRLPMYGMKTWGEIFTSRQKMALNKLADKVKSINGQNALKSSLKEILALALNRVADYSSSICGWHIQKELVGNTFRRQAIPMIWDFCEIAPFADGPGNLGGAVNWIGDVIEEISTLSFKYGQSQCADACKSPLSDMSSGVWFTDPPYYDAIAYSHCSDFFFVWLKRSLSNHPLLVYSENPKFALTPKMREIVVDSRTTKGHGIRTPEFYENSMLQAFKEGLRVLKNDGIGCIVFAHKTTQGWETFLSGMQRAGWTITASWPITTEMGTRLRARESAALATSIHLVCRPRSPQAGVGDWAEVKAEMEERVQAWMQRLQEEGIRGADALFACIGPAMEVYSRYTQVETPAGHPVPLGGDPEAVNPHQRGFLTYVFEAVSQEALRQVLGGADTEGFEEDARLTALFLWTLQVTRLNGNNQKEKEPEEAEEGEEPEEEEEKPVKAKTGLALPFDTFIRITRPMGIHYPDWEQKIIDIEKGVVRLLPVLDRQEALFGEELAVKVVELKKGPGQRKLFPDEPPVVPDKRRGPGKAMENLTTLDRIHQAMLLYAAGKTTTLKGLLDEEIRKGKRFERLAFSLMALYPLQTPERKWLEGLQAIMKTR